jgi:hypothetical protein
VIHPDIPSLMPEIMLTLVSRMTKLVVFKYFLTFCSIDMAFPGSLELKLNDIS